MSYQSLFIFYMLARFATKIDRLLFPLIYTTTKNHHFAFYTKRCWYCQSCEQVLTFSIAERWNFLLILYTYLSMIWQSQNHILSNLLYFLHLFCFCTYNPYGLLGFIFVWTPHTTHVKLYRNNNTHTSVYSTTFSL